jgi:hypothetical protein
MAVASDALSRSPENQDKCHKEKQQVPVKRRATRLRKGDDKGLTEYADVLPESHVSCDTTKVYHSSRSKL